MLIELTTLKGEIFSVRVDIISYVTKCKGGTSIALTDGNWFTVKESYSDVVSWVNSLLIHSVVGKT